MPFWRWKYECLCMQVRSFAFRGSLEHWIFECVCVCLSASEVNNSQRKRIMNLIMMTRTDIHTLKCKTRNKNEYTLRRQTLLFHLARWSIFCLWNYRLLFWLLRKWLKEKEKEKEKIKYEMRYLTLSISSILFGQCASDSGTRACVQFAYGWSERRMWKK